MSGVLPIPLVPGCGAAQPALAPSPTRLAPWPTKNETFTITWNWATRLFSTTASKSLTHTDWMFADRLGCALDRLPDCILEAFRGPTRQFDEFHNRHDCLLGMLGGVDGFDEDEAESKGHNGAVVLGCLLAAERNSLEALELTDKLLDAGARPIERFRKECRLVLG